MQTKTCEECGKNYKTTHLLQKFCSWACLSKYRARIAEEIYRESLTEEAQRLKKKAEVRSLTA